MIDYSALEIELCDTLALRRRPVALIFGESIPSGIPKFEGTEPSACSFWRIAAEGRVFYTIPGDHCNCAMGSYTLNYSLAQDRAGELEQAFSRITSSGYVKMEEIPSIPRLKQSPNAVVYSPLGETPADPDLVIIVARPLQAMILQEAAVRAGIGLRVSLFGRPTCMSLPDALNQGMITSAGCLGNRVYTDLADDELYVLLPGRALRAVTNEVKAVAESNSRIADYHRARRASLKTPPG